MQNVSKPLVKMALPLFHANTHGNIADDPRNQMSNNQTAKNYSSSPSSCGDSSAWHAAAEYVGLIPRGNFGNSPEGGCAIDTHSSLIFGDSAGVKFKGPKQLFQRPFATTPFLGLGTLDGIPDQNKVMFGHATANRKSIQTVSDKQFPVFEPLIQERKDDISENNYFVEPFLRGGMASRLVPKTRIDLTK